MQLLDKNVLKSTLPDQPQGVYSHGLEAIYAIETIDLRSLKKLSVPSTPEEEQKPLEILYEQDEVFDLGPRYRGWMVPYILLEPIQVLSLSKLCEKVFLEKDIKSLGDLHALSFQEGMQKNIVKGHLEEAKERLRAYLSGKSLSRTSKIDFISILKVLSKNVEKIPLYLTLEPFGLADWIVLSPSEQVDIRKVTGEKREELVEEVCETLLRREKFFLEQAVKDITETFILPWVEVRGGVSAKWELLEYLQLKAEDKKKVYPFFAFLDLIKYPFFKNELFVLDKEAFTFVTKIARSYFPNATFSYPKEELIYLIQRELSLNWISYPEIFIENVLKSECHLYRDLSGKWWIKK